MDVSRTSQGDAVIRTPHDIALALPMHVDEGEIRRYELSVPWLPPSKNVYDRWPVGWQAGHKAKWIRRIVEECEALDMPKGVPRIGLAAKLVFPTRRTIRDPQNYAATLWNFVPDALEARQHGTWGQLRTPLYGYGLIADDRDGRIEWGPNHGLRFAFDERPGVPKTRRQRTRIYIAVRMG